MVISILTLNTILWFIIDRNINKLELKFWYFYLETNNKKYENIWKSCQFLTPLTHTIKYMSLLITLLFICIKLIDLMR